jgi:diguanylate cyclase (GGDEF)-like protein/PAS domain S-box-containing protein
MTMWRDRPIRYLIVGGTLLIAAIVAGTAIMVGNFRDHSLADSERELKNTALILAEQIDRSFQALALVQRSVIDKIQSLGVASSEDSARRLSDEDVHQLLKNQISGLPHVARIAVFDSDGKLVNSSQSWPIPVVNIADREYFKAVKSDSHLSALVSEPVQNRANGAWTIVLARKLTGPNGVFLGVVLGAVDASYLERLFGAIVLTEHSSIALYRGDGILLARYPRIESAIGKPFKAAAKALGSGNSGAIRFVGAMEGKDRLLAAHRLAHYPLYISVAVDTDAALARWQTETEVFLGAGGLAAVTIAIMIFLIVRQLSRGHELSKRSLALEKQRLDMAINHMPQGLLLFDSSERIVVCNRRYIEMYGLSPDVIKPGCSFRRLIRHRKETGSFAGDVDEYYDSRLRDLAQGKVTETIVKTRDGRSVQIVHEPIPNGGWVSTHEDITVQQRLVEAQNEAQNSLREQKLQLDAALSNMMQGLCMFDADGRIVLFNPRYVEMMGLPADDLMGRSLLDIFEYRKTTGQFTGDPKQFFTGVLATVREGHSTTRIMEASDGRALRVVDQPMVNGGWVATFEDITEQRKIEQERDRDREFLNQIVDNIPVMIVVKDASERKLVLANRAAEAFWGFSRDEAIGKTMRELAPRGQVDLIDKCDIEALQSDSPLVLDAHPTMLKPGDGRLVTTKRVAIRGKDGKAKFLISVVEDVTARKQLEEERDRQREFLNQIINNVPATIIVKDARSRRYVLVNQTGVDYFGASREQIIGKSTEDIFPSEIADLIAAHDEKVLRSSGSMFFDDFTLNTRGRGARFVTSKKIVIRDGTGEPQYLLGVIEDVTERKLAEEQIARLARYDALTELANRVFFRQQLEHALKQLRDGERVAVLYIDLDNFKSVNDTLGHSVGDELLKDVASRLRGCLQNTDIAGRLGGDEFAIVQTAVVDPKNVTDLVNRIHEVIRTPFEVGAHQLAIDTSIGIALAPDDGADPDQLLKCADLAMYGAKTDGRSTYRFFEPEMDTRVKLRRSLEFDLRESIMCGGLELYYQPLVNLGDGKINGCEALLRWFNPKRGTISPVEFISIAEETGLINQLGEWVLRTACAEAMNWPENTNLAVNVSPVQFKAGNLVQTVAASGLQAHRLELEITESVLIRDDEATLHILHQLRKLGVRISMDDFGTGYSSLNYLQRFPFDKIKIDRSFINSVASANGSLSIVQAVVNIAKSRNITTTAEGVETEQQLELLRALGCTEFQGYLFSRPRPAVEIRPLLMSFGERAVAVA